jgi:hypothetical protein
MIYELVVRQEIEYETEDLDCILEKFYSECTWHLTIKIKDKDCKELELGLEVNDMEANIKYIDSDWYETEWNEYNEDMVQTDIENYGLDYNSIILI